jgi:hypothetical protein
MNYPELNLKAISRTGGVICFILLAYSIVTLIVMSITGGPPVTAEDAFSILNENLFKGLLRLDLLTVFVIPLYYLLFFSLYTLLSKTNPTVMIISIILAFAGITLFLSAPSVFSYLDLSNKFSSAITGEERSRYLAAGEAIISSDIWHGTSPRIGGLMMQTGWVMISFVMLREQTFSKLTAVTGIVTHGLDLIHIVIGFFMPAIGDILMFLAGPLYLIWFPLVGTRLIRLGSGK